MNHEIDRLTITNHPITRCIFEESKDVVFLFLLNSQHCHVCRCDFGKGTLTSDSKRIVRTVKKKQVFWLSSYIDLKLCLFQFDAAQMIIDNVLGIQMSFQVIFVYFCLLLSLLLLRLCHTHTWIKYCSLMVSGVRTPKDKEHIVKFFYQPKQNYLLHWCVYLSILGKNEFSHDLFGNFKHALKEINTKIIPLVFDTQCNCVYDDWISAAW